MIKSRVDDKRIYVESPYNKLFIKRIKEISGKWHADTTEWSVPKENRDMLNKALLEAYGEDLQGKNEIIKVEYLGKDFTDFRENVYIGELPMVTRRERDIPVSFHNNTVLWSGSSFPGSGGSRNNPAAEPKEDTVLRSDIPLALYENLSDKEKEKLKIIETETPREKLIEEKEKLLKRLEEIEKELEEIEK